MKHILIIAIGVIIICLLFINLFTPEIVKRQNYAKFLKNRPHIEYVERKESYNCPETRPNPEYTQLKKIEAEKGLPAYKLTDEFQTCMEQQERGSDWMRERICSGGYEPDLSELNRKLSPTITKDKKCERVIGKEAWLSIFARKIYMLKYTSN